EVLQIAKVHDGASDGPAAKGPSGEPMAIAICDRGGRSCRSASGAGGRSTRHPVSRWPLPVRAPDLAVAHCGQPVEEAVHVALVRVGSDADPGRAHPAGRRAEDLFGSEAEEVRDVRLRTEAPVADPDAVLVAEDGSERAVLDAVEGER